MTEIDAMINQFILMDISFQRWSPINGASRDWSALEMDQSSVAKILLNSFSPSFLKINFGAQRLLLYEYSFHLAMHTYFNDNILFYFLYDQNTLSSWVLCLLYLFD